MHEDAPLLELRIRRLDLGCDISHYVAGDLQASNASLNVLRDVAAKQSLIAYHKDVTPDAAPWLGREAEAGSEDIVAHLAIGTQQEVATGDAHVIGHGAVDVQLASGSPEVPLHCAIDGYLFSRCDQVATDRGIHSYPTCCNVQIIIHILVNDHDIAALKLGAQHRLCQQHKD